MTLSDHIAHCHALLDQNPQDWDTRLRLADLLLELGDEDGAACQRWIVEARLQISHDQFGWHTWWTDMVSEYLNSPNHHATRQSAERQLWWWTQGKQAKIRIEGP